MYLDQSKNLGSEILKSFNNNYLLPVNNMLSQREKAVFILKENKYPAVLIGAGFITSKKDVDYLLVDKNQEAFARNILNGIEKYAEQESSFKAETISGIKKKNTEKEGHQSLFDTIPQYYKGKKIKNAFGSNKLNKAIIVYDNGTSHTLSISEAEKLKIIPPPPPLLWKE